MPPLTPRTTRIGCSSRFGVSGRGGRRGQQAPVDLTQRDRHRLLVDLGLDERADVVEQALLQLGVVGVDLTGALGGVDDERVLRVGGGQEVVDRRVGDADGSSLGTGHSDLVSLVSAGFWCVLRTRRWSSRMPSAGTHHVGTHRSVRPDLINDTSSSLARRTSSLTMTSSNSLWAASSAPAAGTRRSRSASPSVPRPTSRRTSSSQLGGARKTKSASGQVSRTWRAPCRSISSSASRPSRRTRSTGPRGVPYLAAPWTTACSRNSPASTSRSNSWSSTKW